MGEDDGTMRDRAATKRDPDPGGWTTRVAHIGRGRYGVQVLRDGRVHAQTVARTKADVGGMLKDLLRWVDKLGYDSPMAAASRVRNKKGRPGLLTTAHEERSAAPIFFPAWPV